MMQTLVWRQKQLKNYTEEIIPLGENNNPVENLDDENNLENKKKRPMKRKPIKELWERNNRKKRRLSGESYTTPKGKVMPQKVAPSIE